MDAERGPHVGFPFPTLENVDAVPGLANGGALSMVHSRRVIRLVFSVGLTAILAGCGAGASNVPAASAGASNAPAASGGVVTGPKVSIKLVDDFTPADPLNTFLQKFADEVNQKAGGSITVTLFNGSQLGSETDIDRQLSNGAVQMSMVGVTGYAPLDAFFTPFAVQSTVEAMGMSTYRLSASWK